MSRVLHGLTAVAALKQSDCKVNEEFSGVVLHGLTAVAALKREEQGKPKGSDVVLHGLTAVAALKRQL